MEEELIDLEFVLTKDIIDYIIPEVDNPTEEEINSVLITEDNEIR